MAGGLPAYQNDTLGDMPAADVDETREPSNVVHINAETGQVGYERPDGALVVQAPGHDRKPKDDSFDANLAEEPGVPLSTIASRLLEGIEADIQSRRDWEDTANRGRLMLGVKLEEPNTSVSAEGMISSVKNTALLEAVLQAWANARAELLPAEGPVKVADDLPEIDVPQDPAAPPGQPAPAPQAKKPRRSQLGDSLEKDMNHYLTVIDREYVPDFSRMLLNRALDGIQFRKVYRCPLRRRPTSVWVKGADLIVENGTSHLSGAGRVTERITMRQSMVKRMMKAGQWLTMSLVQPTQSATPTEQTIGNIQGVQPVPQLPADHRHTIYECYCELDDGPLANDENGTDVGFPLPYRVTMDKESRRVLEIRRNWKKGDRDYQPRRRYVKYGFVPGFGFYDWGYTHMLGNPQRAATAIERLLIDAGMYCSMPGGLMAKGPGTRQRTNEIKPEPGQFAVVDTGGAPIHDVAMALPYKEPSSVLQAMGATLTGDMRRLSGVLNMPVGEGRVGNVPVGTMLAYVDAITKVPSAIHKDDHAAQMEEFGLLKELFQEEPEALVAGNKNPAREVYTAEELEDQELIPKADPNVPSRVHRYMQVTALIEAAQSPVFQGVPNPRGLWERVCQTLGVENTDEVTLPESAPAPPPPDPKVVAATINNQGKQAQAQADLQKNADNNATKLQTAEIDAATNAQNNASEEKRASLGLVGKLAESHIKAGTEAAGQGLQHAQHLNTLAQADQHHQDQLAATANQDNTPQAED